MVLAFVTIKTLQNLNLKMIHRIGPWHINMDVLSHNFVDITEANEI
jgi:Ni,Fe-hydrogenase I cytochrome b subunit